MDSGNSGSLQSSSGADEHDYDSRAAAADDSMLMSSTTTTSINTHPPPPPLLFDPFSNYSMQLFHNNNSSSSLVHPNNYMDNWPRPGTPRSDPNHHIPNPPMPSNNFQQRPTTAEDMSSGVGPTRKKRSRASRRAPTTVLTTDTTNFRAMVQEFTGIPAPPFSTSTNNSFHPTRLDLFRSAAPPYLRRPFPHKPHHHDPSSTSTTSTTPAPMVNYQQLPIFSTTDHFNNIVPPINPPPHHLQTNPTSYLFTNSLVTASKPQIQPSNYDDVIGGALPSLISSDHANHLSNAASGPNWAAVTNNTNSDGVINGHDGVKLNGGDDRRSNINDNIIAMTRGGSSQGMVESWICSSD